MYIEVRLGIEPVRSLAFGSIVAGYTAIGTALNYPSRMVLLQNWTDANLMFSRDGIYDHIPLLAGNSLIIDITSNKTKDDGFFLSKGDILYVKRIEVPTSGIVYITSFYGDRS